MKRKFLPIALLGTLFLQLLTGCGSGETSSEPASPDAAGGDQVYTFRASHLATPDFPYDTTLTMMTDYMNELAGYEAFEVQLFGSGALAGSDNENTEMTNNGIVEFSFAANDSILYINSDLIKWNIYSMPYTFVTQDALYAFIDGEMGQALLDEATEATNCIVYPGICQGFAILGSNRGPVLTPEDIAGQKLRSTPAELVQATVNAWDATPVNVAYSEIYTALQQGTVDGMLNAQSSWASGGFYEVCDYGTYVNSYSNIHFPVVNKDFYNSLPEDLQAVWDSGMEYFVEITREQMADKLAASDQEMMDGGFELTYLNDEQLQAWKDATADVIQSNVDVVGGSEYFQQVTDWVADHS